MRHSLSVIAMMFVLFPLNVLGQHGGRHATSGTNGGTTPQPEDPDAATFKRAVAEQATDVQMGQFHLMAKSTEAARQQALDLQHLSSNAASSEDLTSKASSLQDSVEKALTDTRIFLQSFSDSQEANLKNLAKKLRKSGAAVNKNAKGISQQSEQQTLDGGRLVRAAASLEKALVEFQADQFSLGKEMGIPSP